MMITGLVPLEKGRVQVCFDCGEPLVLYKGEIRKLALEEDSEISGELYDRIYHEIVGKRVTLRAMHLLEKMDRTEEQLRRRLREGKYPEELIEAAIEYVKSFHYIDDDRYARSFVRLNQDKKSSARMKMDLTARGVAQDIIERALREENETDQRELIKKLLEKRHYDPDGATQQEMRKNYQFLLRRGFAGSDIMHVLNCYPES